MMTAYGICMHDHICESIGWARLRECFNTEENWLCWATRQSMPLNRSDSEIRILCMIGRGILTGATKEYAYLINGIKRT
jgi:hypothetical protein